MIKWIVVFAIAIIIVMIGSVGRIPFTEEKLATSEETRARFAEDNTPTYTRPQAISFVADHLRKNCRSADRYLANLDRFEAKWTRQPWSDDHHEREPREWTVTDPLTGSFWRMYEDSLRIVTVIGDC